MKHTFTAGALLEALAGIAYVVDREGAILGFSRGPFLPTLNGPWDPAQAVGKSLFDIVQGEEVREAYRALHDAVWTGNRAAVGFTYRCDSPDTEREMFLSLSRVTDGPATVAMLYQSVVISEVNRPRMPLFSFEVVAENWFAPATGGLIRMCSYCHRIAWPPGAGKAQEEWIEPVDFYRRGGEATPAISHGICNTCFARVMRAIKG